MKPLLLAASLLAEPALAQEEPIEPTPTLRPLGEVERRLETTGKVICPGSDFTSSFCISTEGQAIPVTIRTQTTELPIDSTSELTVSFTLEVGALQLPYQVPASELLPDEPSPILDRLLTSVQNALDASLSGAQNESSLCPARATEYACGMYLGALKASASYGPEMKAKMDAMVSMLEKDLPEGFTFKQDTADLLTIYRENAPIITVSTQFYDGPDGGVLIEVRHMTEPRTTDVSSPEEAMGLVMGKLEL